MVLVCMCESEVFHLISTEFLHGSEAIVENSESEGFPVYLV